MAGIITNELKYYVHRMDFSGHGQKKTYQGKFSDTTI